MPSRTSQTNVCAIFVHAGAGYHSIANERHHLAVCNDAAEAAMLILRNGGKATDAVEMAIKVLEDREITNAGYGSNLTADGIVECDAIMVDHFGRSGGVGAVAQVKNPISLARLVLEHASKPMLLKRVPPNLLVGQGATDFACEQGMRILPFDAMFSPAARDRWLKWKSDLDYAQRKAQVKAGHPLTPISGRREADPTRKLIAQSRQREEQSYRSAHKLQEARRLQDDVQRHQETMNLHEGQGRQQVPRSKESQTRTNRAQSAYTSPVSTLSDSPSSSGTGESVSDGPVPLAEANRNPLINSTQTIPTMSDFHEDYYDEDGPDTVKVGDSDEDADGGIDDDSDVMVDIPTGQKRKSWHDGSSASESESEAESSSSSTLLLPSITPSPPATGSAQVPLPATSSERTPSPNASTPMEDARETAPQAADREDNVTDTVGAIAVDSFGNIACGASSGGIGMKYRGRVGPAALVGVGAAVIPHNSNDRQKRSVATVTSGTGEHMATVQAATVAAERLYHNKVRQPDGNLKDGDEEEVMQNFITNDFMRHPSVQNSGSAGAIGFLGVKKSKDGIFFYFAHNTDSFALASMHSHDKGAHYSMSRNSGNGAVAFGGRSIRFKRRGHEVK